MHKKVLRAVQFARYNYGESSVAYPSSSKGESERERQRKKRRGRRRIVGLAFWVGLRLATHFGMQINGPSPDCVPGTSTGKGNCEGEDEGEGEGDKSIL